MPPRKTPTIADVTRLVLGAPTRFTASELAAEASVPLEAAVPLWRAMGFADVGDSRAFTRKDLAMLTELLGLVDGGQLTLDEVIELVRSTGQTAGRLAEWQTDTLGRMYAASVPGESPGSGSDESENHVRERLQPMMDGTRALLPVLQRLMIYTWRRQLAAAVGRSAASWEAMDPDVTTSQMSVGFADIVGYTRLSREIPDDELAKLVELFDAVSADIVAATGARVIKTFGDEILFVAEDPRRVAETALRLHEAQAERDRSQKLRIGIGTGSVVSRMGDVFGTTVNRASRLTVMARPRTTFVDGETAEALNDEPDYAFRSVRPRRLRGIGLIRPWSLQRRSD